MKDTYERFRTTEAKKELFKDVTEELEEKRSDILRDKRDSYLLGQLDNSELPKNLKKQIKEVYGLETE